ncbi:hypothetical protein BGW80DRAFT_503058 [Lactifluus volemus]|nr:hypothetical protein BGW80DRAFT_503058 [Lactifluus volemus]
MNSIPPITSIEYLWCVCHFFLNFCTLSSTCLSDISAHLSKLRDKEYRHVTACAYLANPAELEVVLHPVILRPLFSSFWLAIAFKLVEWRFGYLMYMWVYKSNSKMGQSILHANDEDSGVLVGYPGLKMKDAVSFFVWIRRCTSSVQCWAVLTKPLILTDECIIGAAAADILGDVGISSLPRVLIFWNSLLSLHGIFPLPPPIYVHFSVAWAPAL